MRIRTSYKSIYAKQLIDHMKQGASFESFAGVLGVSIETLNRWIKEHSSFQTAYDIGYPMFLLFHEKRVLASDDSASLKLWMQNKLNWKVSDKTMEAKESQPIQLVFKKMETNDGTKQQ